MNVSAPAPLKAPSGTIYPDGEAQGGPFLNDQAIDAMIYSPAHFGEVVVVGELARAGIGDNQLAIVCRIDRGIHELEPHLRRLHGKRLGVIILQKNPNTYTLRQVNPFMPATLEKACERLNLMDPPAG